MEIHFKKQHSLHNKLVKHFHDNNDTPFYFLFFYAQHIHSTKQEDQKEMFKTLLQVHKFHPVLFQIFKTCFNNSY